MAIESRATIKQWFETGDMPTQDQFWAWIDSFFHKTEDSVGSNLTADEIRDLLQTLTGNNKLQAIAILTDTLNRFVTDSQIDLWNAKINPSQLNDAVAALKDNVPTGGDSLRKLYEAIQTLQALVTSNDVNLDTVQEIVNFIKNNKDVIDTISTSKVNKVDIVDNLISTETARPLSARQGKILKDQLTINPTNFSGNLKDQNITSIQDLADWIDKATFSTTPTIPDDAWLDADATTITDESNEILQIA